MARSKSLVPPPAVRLAARQQTPPPECWDEAPQITRRPDMSPEDRVISCLAARLCAAYERYKRDWLASLKGHSNHKAKAGTAWIKTAKLLKSRGWTKPEQYITAQFADGDILRPNQLDKSVAIVRYERYLARNVQDLIVAWDTNIRALEVHVHEVRQRFPEKAMREVWEHVLTVLRYPLQPLFRYCLAASENMPAVVYSFKEQALDQLLKDPEGYLAAWGNRIPDAMWDELVKATDITL